MPTNWRIYKNDTVAAKLDRSDLPGFFGKKVVVGLIEAAFVLRDGQPLEILTESSLQVADALDQMKSQFGMGAAFSVYFVSLAPFDVTIFLGEHKAASANAQTTVHSQVDAAERSLEGIQPGDSAERKSWWLRKAAQRMVWLQEEEPQGHKQQGQASASVASKSEVSRVSMSTRNLNWQDTEMICRSADTRSKNTPQPAMLWSDWSTRD